MKRVLATVGIVTAAALLIPWATAFASGLTVSGAKLVATAAPGDTFTHRITATISKADKPVDIAVSVAPMLQAADGSPRASQGTGAYSAVDFITLDRGGFHLDPGDTEVVNVTVRIPRDVGDGGRYALITVAARPPDDGGLNVISGVDIPVYITIKGSNLVREGSLTGLSTRPSAPSISVSASLQNTGNHDFKFRTVFTVTDSEGRTAGTADTGLSLWTLIPGMSRAVRASVSPQVDMPPGRYYVASVAKLEDGTVIANGNAEFELTTAISSQPVGAQHAVPAPAETYATRASPPAQSGGSLVVGGQGTGNRVSLIIGVAAAVMAAALAGYLFLGARLTGIVHRLQARGTHPHSVAQAGTPVPPILDGRSHLVAQASVPVCVRSGFGAWSSDASSALRPYKAVVTGFAAASSAMLRRSIGSVQDRLVMGAKRRIENRKSKIENNRRVDDRKPRLEGKSGSGPGSSRDSQAGTPVPPVGASPGVVIRYTSATVDQIGTGHPADKASPGYVFLVVDMTIENGGYRPYRVHPCLDFFAVIDNVKFSAARVIHLGNQLPAEIELSSDNGTVRGRMAFEVPRNTTGFRMMYDGYRPYDTRWVGSNGEQGASMKVHRQSRGGESARTIIVGHAETEAREIGHGVLPDVASPDHVFLVADMRIENRGYDSFKVYPRINTYMVIDEVKYSPAFAEGLENMLPGEIDVLNGGRIEGRLAFEVPSNAAGHARELRFETARQYDFKFVEA